MAEDYYEDSTPSYVSLNPIKDRSDVTMVFFDEQTRRPYKQIIVKKESVPDILEQQVFPYTFNIEPYGDGNWRTDMNRIVHSAKERYLFGQEFRKMFDYIKIDPSIQS